MVLNKPTAVSYTHLDVYKRQAHFSKYIRSLKDGTRFCFIDELAGKKIGLWN